ncbi:MAG: thioesterase family protein [Candidatus Nanopelagicales bacterium]|nr:thioesterase family protein [Candidatus Nanopelagicales bacterium]
MDAPIDALLDLLDLERQPNDVFVGASRDVAYTRIFGGQVAAQALVAAGRTVDPEREVHSLHAYFLRPGDPSRPVEFRVERMRDGRGFSVRRVLAHQHGKVTFAMSVSFHLPEAAPVVHTVRAPHAPSPDALPSLRELIDPALEVALPPIMLDVTLPLDIRPVRGFAEGIVSWWGDTYADHPTQLGGGDYPGEDVLWFRADGPMPDDPLLHLCVATYLSDATLLDAVQRRHGYFVGSGDLEVASLDHAMWFHRPYRADAWTLYVTQSPAADRGLGFARGRMFDTNGEIVVSVTQEGLFRRPTAPGAPLARPGA